MRITHRIHDPLLPHPLQGELSELFSFSHLLFSLHWQFARVVQMCFVTTEINVINNADDWKVHLRNTCGPFMTAMHTTPLCVHAGTSMQPKKN